MSTKEKLIDSFDPNGPGIAGNLFGLPFDQEHAELVILPVPWEITVSYHTGTSSGPESILKASSQLDVYVNDIPDAWKLGVAMLPIPQELWEESKKLRALTSIHIARLQKGESFDIDDPVLKTMNEASENLNIYVKSTAQKYLKAGKIVGLVGGEHSVPLGFIRALSEQHDRFGILQIDAHKQNKTAKGYQGLPNASRITYIGPP